MYRLGPLIKFVDSSLVSIHQLTYSYSLIHKTTFFLLRNFPKENIFVHTFAKRQRERKT